MKKNQEKMNSKNIQMDNCWICGRSEDEAELTLVACVCVDHIDCGASRAEMICVECSEEMEGDFP